MSTDVPIPVPAPAVKDDPSKPWKAVASGLVAAILTALTTYFTGSDSISWPGVLVAILNGVVAFLVTYRVRNPKVPVV